MRTLLLLLALIPWPSAAGDQPLRVFVGVPPLQTFVEAVGGRYLEVRSLVQASRSPHAFEPTPGQIADLGSADLYVGIGIPFETAQLPRIKAANPRLRVLDVRDGLELRMIEAHDHSGGEGGHASGSPIQGEHAHPGPGAGDALDPHVWTSPKLAIRIAESIREALSALDPANAGAYEANLRSFATRLEALDRVIKGLLQPIANRRFMVYHPAWGYFADAYDLIQIPIEKGGKEPGPRSLAALIDTARQDAVRVIFVQPQSSRRLADQVAAALGGRVVIVDPLSADYEGALLHAAREIAAAAGR